MLEEHENFVAAVTKSEMLVATQCKVKMSGSDKKVNEITYDTSSINRVTKKVLRVFTLYSCKTTAKKCAK